MLAIVNGDRLAALHAQGLELLGAHDGPEPGAGRDAPSRVHDAGDETQILAPLADARHPESLAVLLTEHLLGFEGVLAPEPLRVHELFFVPVNEQVHRLLAGDGEEEEE